MGKVEYRWNLRQWIPFTESDVPIAKLQIYVSCQTHLF